MHNNNLRHSVYWVLFGNAGRQVLTFLIGVVLARLLTPADFGLLVTINIFTGVLGFVASGGMGQALVQAKKISPTDADTIFTIQLLTGIVVYVFFYCTAPWIAEKYDNPLIQDILRLSAISFVIRPFSNLPSSLLQRDMRFKAKAILGFVTLAATSTTSISLAIAGYGVWSLVWGGVVGAITTAITLSVTAKWRPRINFKFGEVKHHAKFGGLVTASNLILYIRNQTANFLISLHQPAAFLGLYNKADSLRGLPINVISGSIYQVSFRSIAKSQDDIPEAQRLFLRSIKLGLLYTAPIYIYIFINAHALIRFVYGPAWSDAAIPLALLALAGPFMLIANQSGAVTAAFNRLRQEVMAHAAILVIIAISLYITLNTAPTLANIALVFLVITIVSSAWLLSIALKPLELKWSAMLKEIAPAILTNAILFILSYAADTQLLSLSSSIPAAYLAINALLLMVFYAAIIFALPYKENKQELMHWIAILQRKKTNNKPS